MSGTDRYFRIGKLLLFVLISATYFYSTFQWSNINHLWMDDILSVLAARHSSLAGIWQEIWNGSDLSPPTYHVFLHYFESVVGGGNGHIIWRIPSVLALYGAAVCVCIILRDRLSPYVALAAFGLILDSELFLFAVQVRQYAFLTLGLAGALLIWDKFPNSRFPRRQSFFLWLVLSSCLSLHFCGFLVVTTIGCAEVLWLISRRQFRLGIWLPLILTIPVELAWYPLAAHLATFNNIDNIAEYYYAKPSLISFCAALYYAILEGDGGIFFVFYALMMILFACLLKITPLRAFVVDDTYRKNKQKLPLSILSMINWSMLSLPFISYAFSKYVSGSFNLRYIIPASLVWATVFAVFLNKSSVRNFVSLALIPLIVFTLIIRSQVPDYLEDELSVLQAPRPLLPVVIGEGRLYIELMEAADLQTRSTLIYLENPSDVVSPDPTNDNVVRRLKTIHPEYQVFEQEKFLANNPNFYVLARDDKSVDTTTPSLTKKGFIHESVVDIGEVHLYRASSAH